MTDLEDLLTLARKKGPDSAFIAWTQLQPSCLGGDFDQFVHGEGRSIAAHVKRASTGGIGFKGEYAVIPLSDLQHQDQHRYAESGCLERHLGGKWTPAQAKAKFDELRVENLRRWVES